MKNLWHVRIKHYSINPKSIELIRMHVISLPMINPYIGVHSDIPTGTHTRDRMQVQIV